MIVLAVFAPWVAGAIEPGESVEQTFRSNWDVNKNGSVVDASNCGKTQAIIELDITGAADATFAGAIEQKSEGAWTSALTIASGSFTLASGRQQFRVNPSAAPAAGSEASVIFKCQESFAGGVPISAADCTGESASLDELCIETGTGQGVFRCNANQCSGDNWVRVDDTTGAGGSFPVAPTPAVGTAALDDVSRATGGIFVDLDADTTRDLTEPNIGRGGPYGERALEFWPVVYAVDFCTDPAACTVANIRTAVTETEALGNNLTVGTLVLPPQQIDMDCDGGDDGITITDRIILQGAGSRATSAPPAGTQGTVFQMPAGADCAAITIDGSDAILRDFTINAPSDVASGAVGIQFRELKNTNFTIESVNVITQAAAPVAGTIGIDVKSALGGAIRGPGYIADWGVGILLRPCTDLFDDVGVPQTTGSPDTFCDIDGTTSVTPTGSNANTIEDYRVIDNTIGIEIDDARSTFIKSNIIEGNDSYGLQMDDASGKVTIIGNHFEQDGGVLNEGQVNVTAGSIVSMGNSYNDDPEIQFNFGASADVEQSLSLGDWFSLTASGGTDFANANTSDCFSITNPHFLADFVPTTSGCVQIGYGPRTEVTAVETVVDTVTTISADACGSIKLLNSTGAASTNATNTFTTPALGNDGCFMLVCNEDAVDTITLKDNANFVTAAGADIALTPDDCVAVASTGVGGAVDAWRQVAPISTITDVSVTQTELAELETIGATTISLEQWAALGGMANTVVGAELDRLDGLAGIIATDATAVTDLEGTNLSITAGTLNVGDAFVINSGSDVMTGTLTADGLTLGANENITLGAQTLDHDGTDFVFNDSVSATTFTTGATADPSVLFQDSTTSGEAKIAVSDAAGPDSIMDIQTDVAGELTTYISLDGTTTTLHLEGTDVYVGSSTTPSTPDTATAEGDLFVEDALEVDGATDLDGTLNVAGASTMTSITADGLTLGSTELITLGTDTLQHDATDFAFGNQSRCSQVAGRFGRRHEHHHHHRSSHACSKPHLHVGRRCHSVRCVYHERWRDDVMDADG
jgi:parallel beta-helix repeat protein